MNILRDISTLVVCLTLVSCERGNTYDFSQSTAPVTVVGNEIIDESSPTGKISYEDWLEKQRQNEGITAEVAERAGQLSNLILERARAADRLRVQEIEVMLVELDKLRRAYPNSTTVRRTYAHTLGNIAARLANNLQTGDLEYIQFLSDQADAMLRSDTSDARVCASVVFLSRQWIRALSDNKSKNGYALPFQKIRKTRVLCTDDFILARHHVLAFKSTGYGRLGPTEIKDFDYLMRDWYSHDVINPMMSELYVLPGYKTRIDKFVAGEIR